MRNSRIEDRAALLPALLSRSARTLAGASLALAVAMIGCQGTIGGDPTDDGSGAAAAADVGPGSVDGVDAGSGDDASRSADGGAAVTSDSAPASEGDTGASTPPVDAAPVSREDTAPPPPVDAGPPPPSDLVAAARLDCVAEINTYRATLSLPPLSGWTSAESCADGEAKADSESGVAHSAFGRCGEFAQNECPGWPGPPASLIKGCLKMMWDEGPGADFHAHGHYINMSSTSYTSVACGFYQMASGSWWATQDFR